MEDKQQSNTDNNNITTTSVVPYEKLQGAASWLGTSVAAAFFASLERCSCINLSTNEDADEDQDDSLMLSNDSCAKSHVENVKSNDVVDLPV